MFVKISAKSAVTSPRVLIINNKPIYEYDRTNGYRLTVINRNTLDVVFDKNFTNAQDVASYLQSFVNPNFIIILVGHGKNMVYIKIQDNYTGHIIKKSGTNIIYATYQYYTTPENIQKQYTSATTETTTLQNNVTKAGMFSAGKMALLLPLVALGALMFIKGENND